MIYPWQQKQWQQIAQQLQQHKLPHALLLTGPQHMGKRAFAEELAAYLLCSECSQIACGHCRHCLLLAAGNHPDYLQLTPALEGKTIKIEQVRELLAELVQTPQQGEYQIVIIDPAEAMNTAAANALLKNLEEPQGQVVFLLISHQATIIPATVLSRCQRVHFTPPDPISGLSWLQQQLPPGQDAANLLKLAENIPLRALAFAESGWAATFNKIQQQLLQLGRSNSDPMTLAAECVQGEFGQIYSVMWSTLVNLVRSKLAPSHGNSEMAAMAANISSTDLFILLDKLKEMQQLIHDKINLNMQLAYENLLITWAQVLGSVDARRTPAVRAGFNK